jgi:hypothetical protein
MAGVNRSTGLLPRLPLARAASENQFLNCDRASADWQVARIPVAPIEFGLIVSGQALDLVRGFTAGVAQPVANGRAAS